MKAYRRQQLWLSGFLLLSLVVGIGSELTARHEIFPLYSWFLFILVPQKTIAYDVLIHEHAGHEEHPPISYQHADEVVRGARSIVTYRTVQALGRAVETGDTVAAAKLRLELEARFLVSPVRYEIVKLRYDDPLTRWKTGLPQRSESIKTFIFDSTNLPEPTP